MDTAVPIGRLRANIWEMHSRCSNIWFLNLWHYGMCTSVQVHVNLDPSLITSVWLETDPFISSGDSLW